MPKKMDFRGSDDIVPNGFVQDYHIYKRTGSSNAWGDFASFTEGSMISKQLLATEQGADSQSSFPIKYDSLSEEWKTFEDNRQACKSPENVFKLCFPEVAMQQSSEDTKRLDQLLEVKKDEKTDAEEKTPFWHDAVNIWKDIKDANCAFGLKYQWRASHSQKVLFSSLGIDPNQQDVTNCELEFLEDFNKAGVTDLTLRSGLYNHDDGCKALIQTKLAVPSYSGQRESFAYQVFLHGSGLNGIEQNLAIPKKKRSFFSK
ncbi:uncharacterized protein CLBA1 isoform X2 [Latimeria chalumnae]|uniref:uncharacterized protein CLBA1 isoform X2 n=1 Tax=Latimeria chalumnae TaxID=7897 RepID=UPI0003C17682|nr:PREDICTED: uncharacterized protein C14orf79 homolog [Latimeria chalumnae]XP_005986431.1 PREDICTED: uncharacterized protein C14orf79 homolog [Latimeria chalumnae]XP_005986432.1 PREDICTED: uncharacterized protein C14orf79 homolog [Latimeria chalumnae]XP_014340676.1 PREDICTED: uncharacterized protein C14orf79 homolog [Latimeria chalumnae]|eukprot:XP_005986430.1 PREDICTED: uncharacterized protein C14orf79 homolog [Latimeria chalumnae]